jgi:hypothetical protein
MVPKSGSFRRARSRRRAHTLRQVAAEFLEERTLLSSSASLGSAVGIGAGTFGVAVDSSGNRIVTGAFKGTVNVDPGNTNFTMTATGAHDAYVAKYAPSGQMLWVVDIPCLTSTSQAIGRTITTDASGNIYIGGSQLSGSVQFGSQVLTDNGTNSDGFVAKLDSNGNPLWAQLVPAAGNEGWVSAVAVDSSGNVLTVSSGPPNTTQVEKFSSSGNSLWTDQIGSGSGGTVGASSIARDGAGNVYLAGGFTGTVDFDPGHHTHDITGGSNNTAFVLKLTAAGNYGWVSPFMSQNSSSYSSANSVVVDGSNNVVVGGYYYGSVDFDPGRGTHTLPSFYFGGTGVFTSPGFITKLNSSGSLIWAQQVGSGQFGGGDVDSLALDTAGNIYAEGIFANQADFDPGAGTNILTSNGSTDVFVTKFSAAGDYQWAVSVGSTGSDFAYGIAVDASGNVDIVGGGSNPLYFDESTPISFPPGSGNYFLIQLAQS